MGEFEDKLNSILSSPAEMEKLLGMARSLSETMGNGGEKGEKPAEDFVSTAKALGDIDPKVFKIMTRLLTEYASAGSDKTPLINAIKPYLNEDRNQQLEKAAQIAKIAHLAKTAFTEFSGGDKNL